MDAEPRERARTLAAESSVPGIRGPLVFGVVAATIELGILLALLYC